MTAPTLLDTETPAAPVAAGPRLVTIALPTGIDLLNSNQRLHHAPKGKLTAAIRGAAHEAVTEDADLMAALAKAKPGPLFQRGSGFLSTKQWHNCRTRYCGAMRRR